MRSWLIFPFSFLSILASLYHGLTVGNATACFRFYILISLLSGLLLLGDLHLGYGFTAGSFGGVGNVSHLFCLGSPWVSRSGGFISLRTRRVLTHVLGKLAGSGLAKHSGNTRERGVQSVVLFVGFVPKVGLRWLGLWGWFGFASFWGARWQVVFLSTLLFCSRGLLWDMCDGVERAGWFGASSVLLSGFGGFSWAFSPASSGF
jgi:hypothetical protein